MTAPESLRIALEADTDQALAWTREARQRLSRGNPEDDLWLAVSSRLAEVLTAEFPGIPIGRILISVSHSIDAIRENFADPDDTDSLLSVLALAGEQLDREGRTP